MIVPVESGPPAPSMSPDPARWRELYPPSVPRVPQIPPLTVPELLDQVANRFSTAPALTFFGSTSTYGELRAGADRLASALHRLEIRPGDRVALVLPNCPQWVTAWFAILRIGAVVVALNPLSGPDELRERLADSHAEVVIASSAALPAVRQARAGTAIRHLLVTDLADGLDRRSRLRLRWPGGRAARQTLRSPVPLGPDVRRLTEITRNSGRVPPPVTIRPDDLAVLTYTAGAMGAPHAVGLQHGNLIANAYQLVWWIPDARPGREVVYGVLPLFHPYGLTLCLGTSLLLGSRLVLLPGFDQEQLLTAFKYHRPTWFPGVPALFRALVGNRALRADRVTALRAGISVGARLPEETAVAYSRLTASVLVGGYGTCETLLTHASPLAGPGRAGSVGVPLPLTDACIADPEIPEKILGPGEVGELLVRGPQVGPDADFVMDGFARTGDLAVMEADGFCTLLGPVTDALPTADERWCGPGEVEDVLVALPQVARAAAVNGEAAGIVAFLQCHPGAHLNADEVVAECARHLTPDLVPSRVEFREALPLTGAGGVLRRLLREEAVGYPPPAPPAVVEHDGQNEGEDAPALPTPPAPDKDIP